MITKDLRIQAKKRPGLDFCYFRLERNSSEKLTFAQKSASRSNFGNSEGAKLNEKLLFDEKRAHRSTFAPQESIKIKKATSRTRSLKLAENQAETRK